MNTNTHILFKFSFVKILATTFALCLAFSIDAQEKKAAHDHRHDHIHKHVDDTKQTHTKIEALSTTDTNTDCQKLKVEVNGLVCDFCARSLEKVFRKKGLSDSINVDLEEGMVDINLKQGKSVDDKTLTKLITDSGYNVVKINRTCESS